MASDFQVDGNIPTIHILARCLPEAWEKAVLAVWRDGIDVKTEYDKPQDPASKDVTAIIVVADPFAEPRIHKNFPGGPEELEAYRQEVCLGIHDHWIAPAQGKWTYTYHERLFAYCPTDNLHDTKGLRPFAAVDQIDYIVRKCSETFHTRRAQAITWMPTADAATNDPPCLQRLWFRIVEDYNHQPVLNMNSHWRSRDLYKAWFMNVYALTELQRMIAQRISENIGREVKVGRYVDITDSLHIYGKYFTEARVELEKMKDGNYATRSWRSDYAMFKKMTEEAREKLAKDPDWYAKGMG
jgi:thymidylate synthase